MREKIYGIDRSHVRAELTNHIVKPDVGEFTEMIKTERFVLVGNYIGSEPEEGNSAFLTPTMDALIYLTHVISPEDQPNRLLVVARSEVLQNLPPELSAARDAIIPAKKQDGNYMLDLGDQKRMLTHLAQEGVIWMAPAATTQQDGLKLNIKTGSIYLARSNNAHLGILSLETEGTGKDRTVTTLHVQQIELPTVRMVDGSKVQTDIQKKVNVLLCRYALARTALLLPEHQEHGDYPDPAEEIDLITLALNGMKTKGVLVEGGFLKIDSE